MPTAIEAVAAGQKWTSTATVVRPREMWWDRSRGELPCEMLRLWWRGATHCSALCRVSEERRPVSRLDGGEGEGEREGKEEGGGKVSWHRLWLSPLLLIQSSEHCSWMLVWDKLTPFSSSSEGSI